MGYLGVPSLRLVLVVLALLVSLGASPGALAAWPAGPTDSVTVSSVAGSQFNPIVTSDGHGGAFVMWDDRRYQGTSGSKAFAAHITALGDVDPNWPVNGLCLTCSSPGESWPLAVVSDGADGAYFIWSDSRSIPGFGQGYGDYYVQHITAAGVVMGPPDGSLLVAFTRYCPDTTTCPAYPGSQVYQCCSFCTRPCGPVASWGGFSAAADGFGGVLVSYSVTDPVIFPDGAARVHTLRIGGAPGAYETTVTVGNDGYEPTLVAPAGSGGAIVGWEVLRPAGDHDLFVQRLSSQGAPQWGSGVVVGSTPGERHLYSIVLDGSGGAIVVFGDGYEIFAQRIDGTGQIATGWPVGEVDLSNEPNRQNQAIAVTDGAGGAMVAWYDRRDHTGFCEPLCPSDIYLQRVTSSGQLASGWPTTGVPIPGATVSPGIPGFCSGGRFLMLPEVGGGVIASFETDSNCTSAVLAQRFTGAGVPPAPWPPSEAVHIFDPTTAVAMTSMTTDGVGGAIVAWHQVGPFNDADIHASRIAPDGFVGPSWYRDADGDGYGDAGVVSHAQAPPAGFIAGAGDCDDTNPAIHPGASDASCDGVDQDCNGAADDAYASHGVPTTCGVGACQRGAYTVCAGGQEQTACNPGSPAPEGAACNGIDEDCDGSIDENFVPQATSCGIGACERAGTTSCSAGQQNESCVPGTPRSEICNGLDDDCNSLVDDNENGHDADGDGVAGVCDNCPLVNNQNQQDADADGVGDACDDCPSLADPAQSDFDHDGQGDVCDLNDGLIYIFAGDRTHVVWQQEAGYARWNLYRGDMDVMRGRGVYTQVPLSNPIAARFCGLASAELLDAYVPAPGKAAHYLVTGIASGVEGSLGTNSAMQVRPNHNPCPPSGPPTANADAYVVSLNTALMDAAPGVLGNDANPVGGNLTAILVTGTAHGILSLAPDGSFTYTAAEDYAGSDSFQYKARDVTGLDSAPALVSIDVRSPWSVVPDVPNDFFQAVSFSDTMNGLTVGATTVSSDLGVVLRTSDGGATWSNTTPTDAKDLQGVSCPRNTTLCVAVGTHGKIYRSTDRGASWTNVSNAAFQNYLNAVFFGDAQHGIAVGWSEQILFTSDGGQTWQGGVSTASGNLNDVFMTDAANGWMVGDEGKVFRTTNGGNNWTAQTMSSLSSGGFFAVDMLSSSVGITVGYGPGGVIFRTLDGGANWTSMNMGAPGNRALWEVRMMDTSTVFVAGGDGIYRTTNAGAAWTRELYIPGGTIFGLAMFDATRGIAVGPDGRILRRSPIP